MRRPTVQVGMSILAQGFAEVLMPLLAGSGFDSAQRTFLIKSPERNPK
jgi:hypothetical protein